MNNSSMYPCPICTHPMCIIGSDKHGKKIGSCGCSFRFKKTKSEKLMDRKYISTKWGLELKK